MKNKRIKIALITIAIMLLIQVNVFASTLTLKTITNKEKYDIGDKVVVTIDWTEKMQAAGFTIKYDAKKMKFESASIANTFYNTETVGEIKVNWASMEEVDYTKITFTFKAIEEGTATVSVQNPNSFADGNLTSPEDYNVTTYGTKNISINQKTNNEEENDKDNNKEDNTNNNNTINNKDNTIKKDNTTANGKMPQTGKESITIFTITALIVFGIIGVIKYKKLSDI